MKPLFSCPHCQSEKIVPNVKVTDRDETIYHSLKIELHRNPKAIFFRKTKRFEVKAHVCASCGYVHMFIEQPNALWEAYQQQQNPE